MHSLVLGLVHTVYVLPGALYQADGGVLVLTVYTCNLV